MKRTSSGLAKAVAGHESGFDDDFSSLPGSEDNPVCIDNLSPRNKRQTSQVFFNEDDFDSDIELEVEDPAAKPSLLYSTLPKPPASPKLVPYPKIHQARFHTATSDSACVSQSLHNEPPPSSVPIPWSSSPDTHKRTPPGASAFAGFAYTGANISKIQAANSVQLDELPPPDSTAHRPTKRRTLPWLEADAREMEQNQRASMSYAPAATRPKSQAPEGLDFTPLPKNSEVSQYPWNTTASAVKEQQKLLRKANKKLFIDNDATDEAKAAAIVKKKSTTVARPHLSAEQRHVLDLVVEQGKSVFFTGSAGTGKSVLLREIIAVLRKKYSRESDRIAITASTGLAACNVGGVTLHSFAGIGLGKEDVDELVKKIKRNQKAKHRWMRTKVLVVDEVSMVDGELFDKLEEIARRLRNNGRPFGGIQLVITGDFFQLPPVPDQGSGRMAKFSFDANSWKSSIEHTIGLHHVFRQKDPVFAGMLNEMREGVLSPASVNAFKKLSRPLPNVDTLSATELFPTRAEVDTANNSRMRQLVGEAQRFEARDGGTIVDKAMRDKLLGNCMAPVVLDLKKGSQVMLIKNIDETLVNGSVGKVIGFMSEETFNGYSTTQNNQGSDDEEMTTKETKQRLKIDSMLANTGQRWPAVRFMNADGTTRDLLCQREMWKVELPNGEVQASRAQVPLILAWALSIHKAQGQTLERVKVDLGKVFEKGQAYVALSRATSMAGLQVLRFDPSKVLAHERVRNFYAGLTRAENAGRAPSVDVEDIKPKKLVRKIGKDVDNGGEGSAYF